MSLLSEILGRSLRLPAPQTRDVEVAARPARHHGRRRRAARRPLRPGRRGRTRAADRPRAHPVRPPRLLRRRLRAPARRARLPGRRAERARDVRVRRALRAVRRARRRPGDAALAARAAVVRGAGGHDRLELHGAGAVGGRRGGGGRARRPRALDHRVAVPRPGVPGRQPGARHRAVVDVHHRRPGAAAVPAAARARAEPPAAEDPRRAAPRRARRARRRRVAAVLPRVVRADRARRALLAAARLLPGRRARHGARPAHRRLVRHLPALDDRGPRRAAAGGARQPS